MTATLVTALAPKLSAYSLLVGMLVDQRISSSEFEALYLQLYQDDPTDWPIDVLDVLEGVFADLDELFALGSESHTEAASAELIERVRPALAVLTKAAAQA